MKQVESKEHKWFECKEKETVSVRKKLVGHSFTSPDPLCTFFHPALCLGADPHGLCQWILHLLTSCWVQPMQVPRKTYPLEVHLDCCVLWSKVIASFQLTCSIRIFLWVSETTPSLHPFRPGDINYSAILSSGLTHYPLWVPLHLHCPNLNKLSFYKTFLELLISVSHLFPIQTWE